MWAWIDRTLSESKSFDYLFVAGHYQVLDSRGEYDKALVHNLLPMLRKYNVQGYFQGHRHTMEHNQGKINRPARAVVESLRFFSKADDRCEVKILKQVVFRTDFLADQKLPPVNQWSSRKAEGKKVKFFLPRRKVKFIKSSISL